MRLSGRVVVITGAGGGIGRSVALAFAAEGADLVLGDLTDSVESAAEDARRIGVKALAVRGDVAQVTDMVTLVAKAVDELGRLDVLVTRSEEHTSELQSQSNLVCRLLLEKKKD